MRRSMDQWRYESIRMREQYRTIRIRSVWLSCTDVSVGSSGIGFHRVTNENSRVSVNRCCNRCLIGRHRKNLECSFQIWIDRSENEMVEANRECDTIGWTTTNLADEHPTQRMSSESRGRRIENNGRLRWWTSKRWRATKMNSSIETTLEWIEIYVETRRRVVIYIAIADEYRTRSVHDREKERKRNETRQWWWRTAKQKYDRTCFSLSLLLRLVRVNERKREEKEMSTPKLCMIIRENICTLLTIDYDEWMNEWLAATVTLCSMSNLEESHRLHHWAEQDPGEREKRDITSDAHRCISSPQFDYH